MKRFLVIVVTLCFAGSLTASDKDGQFKKTEKKIPGQYIVVLRPTA